MSGVDHTGPVHPRHLAVNLKLAGSNCNMRCRYCYEHDDPRWANRFLEPAEVEAFVNRLPEDVHLRFLLHGGEPLLYPKDQMRALLQTIERRCGGRSEVRIQTNGTLIDLEWIDLFRTLGDRFVWSVSVDAFDGDETRRLPGRRAGPVVREKLALLRSAGATVGVVMVISQWNRPTVVAFLEELIELGVAYATINKMRRNTGLRRDANDLGVTEMEFVETLERVTQWWIGGGHYRRLQIQPLMTLLAPSANQICTFLDAPDKCGTFVSLYPGGELTGCDHWKPGAPHRFAACATCSIRSWCGSGCVGEEKDETFCAARFRLKALVDGLTP
jgi:uncharacterized protein